MTGNLSVSRQPSLVLCRSSPCQLCHPVSSKMALLPQVKRASGERVCQPHRPAATFTHRRKDHHGGVAIKSQQPPARGEPGLQSSKSASFGTGGYLCRVCTVDLFLSRRHHSPVVSKRVSFFFTTALWNGHPCLE